MLVEFKKSWFAPGAVRYRKRHGSGPVFVPDELREFLPPTAVVVEETSPPPVDEVEEERKRKATRAYKNSLHQKGATQGSSVAAAHAAQAVLDDAVDEALSEDETPATDDSGDIKKEG